MIRAGGRLTISGNNEDTLDLTLPAKFKRTDLTTMIRFPSVDFSYKRLTTIEDLEVDNPKVFQIDRTPIISPNNKYMTASLWLNNNYISDVLEMVNIIEMIVEEPQLLVWLDLSNNQITEVDENFHFFPVLTILYLHGNNIAKIQDIEKLQDVKSLRSLTLFWNPVDTIIEYRKKVAEKIPQITTLDFNVIRRSTEQN